MGRLLESRSFSDVTLVVGGARFEVHRAILGSRSPVFEAMFEHEMAEKQAGVVVVTDMEEDVMRELLRFLYTGTAPNLDRLADELLAAADRYQCERLKTMCEAALCAALSPDNACNTLTLADLHSASQLKAQAVHFINAHAAEVMESEGWAELVGKRPHLLAEAFKALATQQSPPLLLCGPPRKRLRQV